MTTVFALAGLVIGLIQAAQAKRPAEYALIALTVGAAYSTGPAVGNGQLTVHVLAALTIGLLLLFKKHQTLYLDLAGSSLIIFALIKPTLAAPFVWLIVFIPQRIWPIALVVVGYAAIALLACIPQTGNVLTLYADWLHRGVGGTTWSSAGGGGVGLVDIGYGNLHNYLGALGLSHLNMAASLGLLCLLGGWIYCHRHQQFDPWLAVGIAAIVARLWTYHLVYDDMLILLPMAAVYRLQKYPHLEPSDRAFSQTLLAITLFFNLLPASLRFAASPLDIVFQVGVTLNWLTLMGWLLVQVHRWKLPQPAPLNLT
ncbi:MAG: hypothetical protein HC816_07055 [Leptolyngbyaceae cyanobacterium RM1_1_2]|nr:hypothetical protein [Leptolyngbyaceae cyanobacterium RM1_1_2]